MEVSSFGELVAGGIHDLQILANKGNSVASEWLVKIQAELSTEMKLALFGEMRIALRQDTRSDARIVAEEMFSDL